VPAEPRQARRELPATEIHQRALARIGAPSAVVDAEHNIVHMSDNFAQYLRVSGDEPSRNLLALVVPELRTDLRSALYQAQRTDAAATGREVHITRDGKLAVIEIAVHPFRDDEAGASFLLVILTEGAHAGAPAVPAGAGGEQVIAELEAELQRKKEQLQQTVENAEVSNQQLRAANEELQAINEELRSASEELETSKEEQQSMNEELVTVNYELKLRVDETAKANDDLNNLIASTDIATVFVDSAMSIKRFTPRALDIFSILPTDVGRSLLDLTHRLDYRQLADDVATAFNTLQLVEREVKSVAGRHYIARVVPYRTTDDRIDGAVLTFFDITRSREAEEKLRAGEARMRLVAESTRDYAIVTVDPEGRTTSWNQGAERMFGYKEQEVLGRGLDFLYLPEDRARGALADELRRALEDGRAEAARWHLRKDGSRVFAAGVTSPLHNQEFDGFVKIARDETERMREEQEREDELSSEHLGRRNAETASALKDEFLAIMAHELRRPLNLIHINVELLARLPELRQLAPAARAAGVIRNAVLSQTKIIDDLLDMSRVRTGKLTLSMAPLDLAQVAQAAIEATRADPAASALTVELQGAEVSLKVLADPVRMEQVLMNLLSNAVKFTPAGKVTMALSREQDEARVDVIDTGQGMAPSFLPKVFDMFGQPGSATARAKGGLGIGLALVREIVTLHGGRVEAASEGIGKGARFSFWLPLLAGTAEPEPASVEPAHNIAGVRVLLVDDNEDAALVCKALLEMHGANVSVATSAREALGLLENQDCDVLVSDISMPLMDGYELLREVRKLPRHAGLPAIAVTGLAREQDIAAARAAGFAAHIGKPMSVERLAEIIAGLLPAHRDAAA
jgi:two-component system CheB/CheR fusion protein